jgi:hypothetical protein
MLYNTSTLSYSDSCITYQLIQAYHQYDVGSRPLCILQKRCTRLAVASDKAYQLLARGRWFFPGTPASSTTKAGRLDITKILLKVALKHNLKKKTIRKSASSVQWIIKSLNLKVK